MKLSLRLKLVLFGTLFTMYFTGAFTWMLGQWFQVNEGFGPQSSPLKMFWLQMHSISSLWFLALFGYIFNSHIIPSWKRGRKKFSGAILTGVLIFLCLTVPGLFYITNDAFKNNVAFVHTYVGLAVGVLFLLHYFSKRV